jgi:uncharacterized membrane protein
MFLSLLVSLLTMVAMATATTTSASAAAQHAATVHVQPAAASDQYELHFKTTYTKSPVDIALLYKDYSGTCDNYGGWATEGWWHVSWDSGRGDVHPLNTPNRYVAYYARSSDGKETWAGTDSHMYVNLEDPFSSCLNIRSSTWTYVGLKTIDMGPNPRVYTHTLLYGG